jgi:signal transduction histidine kinase
MLKSLRIRLSLLYLAASLGLVILLGTGTYGILTLYFQRSTDLALQYRMAVEFRSNGLSLPSSLAGAEQDWNRGGNQTTSTPSDLPGDSDDEYKGDEEYASTTGFISDEDDRYDGSLAPIFVLPSGGVAPASGVPIVNDLEAISQAHQAGMDLRTIRMEDGSRLRLLTYSLEDGDVLQVGRLLDDQDRLLSQYLTGLIVLGSAGSFVLALISWLMAGRSIRPAQRAWDQQQQFISNASHELRTPLTILRANADYALRNTSAEEKEQSLREIVSECDYMNLLLLSRLDAHRQVLQTEVVYLPDLLEETNKQMAKVAQTNGVQLTMAGVQGSVRADRVRLRQVLLILLDNAMRFTAVGGTITLGAEIRGHEVIISVVDNGVGIASEHLTHVFERFYQVPGKSGNSRGNGLGLSIARALVEALHGKIHITNQPGQGTRVQISLPGI